MNYSLISLVNGIDNSRCATRSNFPGMLPYRAAFRMFIDFNFFKIRSGFTDLNVNECGKLPNLPRILITLGWSWCLWMAAEVSVISSSTQWWTQCLRNNHWIYQRLVYCQRWFHHFLAKSYCPHSCLLYSSWTVTQSSRIFYRDWSSFS